MRQALEGAYRDGHPRRRVLRPSDRIIRHQQLPHVVRLLGDRPDLSHSIDEPCGEGLRGLFSATVAAPIHRLRDRAMQLRNFENDRVVEKRRRIIDKYCDCGRPQQRSYSPAATGQVPDLDAVFERAVAAGAEVHEALSTFVSGDRFASIHDPFGVRWSLMSRVEDLSPTESAKRVEEWAASFSASAPES